MGCRICGHSDLYTDVVGEGVCSICKMKFIGGLTATSDKISEVRAKLGLEDGEFFKQDNAAEARRFLGR